MYMQEEDKMYYQCVYPDVYYKIQPFAMMACDEMDEYDNGMPDHGMVRQISDRIYEDVCRIHPDLAELDHYQGMSYEATAAYNMTETVVEAQQYYRGGVLRDLVTIIFLNELFGRGRRRRRRRYYW